MPDQKFVWHYDAVLAEEETPDHEDWKMVPAEFLQAPAASDFPTKAREKMFLVRTKSFLVNLGRKVLGIGVTKRT